MLENLHGDIARRVQVRFFPVITILDLSYKIKDGQITLAALVIFRLYFKLVDSYSFFKSGGCAYWRIRRICGVFQRKGIT